jgi:hypothetical protein
MSANKTYFNRHSSNISIDGALAVFDILPTDDIAAVDGSEYVNGLVSVTGINFLDSNIRYFPIQSSHCTKRSTAYYLNRRGTRYAEFPQLGGVPMNYGGAPLARYKALSEDLVTEEPLLLVPTFGMTHGYDDRAKSLEFWINAEPYARNKYLNLFHDSIANLTPLTIDNHTVISGSFIEVSDNTAYSSQRGSLTYQFTGATEVDFLEPFTLVGGKNYRFTVMLSNPSTQRTIDFNFSMVVGDQIRTETITFSPVNNDDFASGFSQEFGLGGTTWVQYASTIYVDELVGPSTTTLNVVSSNTIKMSELTIIDDDDGIVQTPTYRNTLIEFGGKTKTNVRISADAEFLYLEGYGEVSNFQVGEWARPLYVVCVDNVQTFDVYVDCERVMTITKNKTGDYGSVVGEWALFYISPLFKYIDLSTISVYSNALGADIQRLHHLFGYGPKYNDIITNNQYDKIYVADGSATTFSSQVLFPQLHPFSLGEARGVSMSDYLALPEYQLPTLFNASYDDITITELTGELFGTRCFSMPIGSEMSLSLKDIGENISYVFMSVSPSQIDAGIICRVQAKNLSTFCDIKMTPENNGIKVSSNMTYATSSGITYGQYDYLVGGGMGAYVDDPNYQAKTYREVAGQAAPFWTDTTNAPQDFTVILNINALQNHEDVDIAALFGDSNLEFRFIGGIPYRTIAVASEDSVYANGMLLDGETELPGISMDHKTKADDPFGNPVWEPVRKILGKAEYALYPNEGKLDIAATGYWYVSIPLTNFASYLDGVPDLDFITYTDQGQSPQLVSSLSTDTMTYDEVEAWVDAELRGNVIVEPGTGNQWMEEFQTDFGTPPNSVIGDLLWEGGFDPNFDDIQFDAGVILPIDNPLIGEYDDLQKYTDSFDPDLPYSDLGISVDSSIPSLGRFADPVIRTYVTLDSPLRWPYKIYADLKTELASSRGFIDFDISPNSVVDTKWEIFDGFSIRIPRGINLFKYNLGFSVHISSKSLNTRRPTFRRAEFFGVSSGDFASNQISVGSGNTITIGDRNSDINIYTPYSTHLSTETVPSNYFSRELGFYPHGESDNVTVHPVYFKLASANRLRVISMYVMWRAETFRTTAPEDLIGTILYDDGVGHTGHIKVIAVTDQSPSKAYQAANIVTDLENLVYVDGIEDGQLDVGRWHLVQINIGPIISIAERPVKFKLENSRCIVNFVASHSVPLSATNLYASRFGTTDNAIFGDDFSSSTHFGGSSVATIEDIAHGVVGSSAKVVVVKNPLLTNDSGVQPTTTRRYTLDGN